MFDLTSKLEINISKTSTAVEVADTGTFAAKYRCPAIIVPPAFVTGALVERSKLRAQYKVIVAVDFDKGANYALDKFKSLNQNVFQTDGYDVVITEGKNLGETINEMKALTEFIKTRINPILEVRYVLGILDRKPEAIELILKAAKMVPPAFIRTDPILISARNVDHESIIKAVRQTVPYPIKLSCNVTFEVCQKCKEVSRFDVTTTQAREIVRRRVEADAPVDKKIKTAADAFKFLGYSEEEAARRALTSKEAKK